MTKLFFAAGEPSGDTQAAELIRALKQQSPSCQIEGIGLADMEAAGCKLLFSAQTLSIMGFTAILGALPRLLSAFWRVRAHILANQFDAVVLVDFGGFNLRLAKSLRKHGYKGKIVYFIPPQIWAWRTYRIRAMQRCIDAVLCIYPFEVDFYDKYGIKAHYVGNPVVAKLDGLKREIDPHCLALFPGSRSSEIALNLPEQLTAAKELVKQGLQIHVSCAKPHHEAAIHTICQKAGIEVVIHKGSAALMQKARFALSTSGTMTLELACMGIPTVVTYRIPKVTSWIVRHIFGLRKEDTYALPNILAKKPIFPEVIDEDSLNPELLRKALTLWQYKELCEEDCAELCSSLRIDKPAELASSHLLQELAK